MSDGWKIVVICDTVVICLLVIYLDFFYARRGRDE